MTAPARPADTARDGYYILNEAYALRGWKKLPCAVQRRSNGETEFYGKDEFFLPRPAKYTPAINKPIYQQIYKLNNKKIKGETNMKTVTIQEFLDLVKSDTALHDSYKAALEKAGDKNAAEVAESLGYKIEAADMQALDDDLLAPVAGGMGVIDYGAMDGVIDVNALLNGMGDFNYSSLADSLNAACHAKR